MFLKSRFMLPFAILGPYHPPHMFPKSRFMQLFTVFRNSVPTLPLCCYLLYLGPITLPTYVPKVEVYVPICAVLGPCHPPHICTKSRFMLLFTVLGLYHPPQIWLGHACFLAFLESSRTPSNFQNRGLGCYLRYLGLITLPKYAPKVEVYVSIYSTLLEAAHLVFIDPSRS